MPAQSGAIATNIVTLLRGLPTTLLTLCTAQITASGSLQTVTPLGPNGMAGITNGTMLSVDAAAPESVVVANATATTFQAIFTLNHSGTWTIGTGSNLYDTVKLGTVQDPTDVGNYGALSFQTRKTERFASGWRVNSTPVFQIESGFDLTGADSSVVELAMLNAADILTYLFVQRYTLNSVAQGVYVTLVDMDDRGMWKVFPNGRVYRVHQAYAKVIDQFNVSLTP